MAKAKKAAAKKAAKSKARKAPAKKAKSTARQPAAKTKAKRDKFKIGDRVTFTPKCDTAWWFGPHTKWQSGVICGADQSGCYKYRAVMFGCPTLASINDEHATLARKAA